MKKTHSFVILLSLTLSFVCAILLVSFLVSENRADSFHPKANLTYQIFSSDPFGGSGKIPFLTEPTAPYMKDHFPEITGICRIGALDNVSLSTNKDPGRMTTGILTDSTFFEFFGFTFLEGEPRSSLHSSGVILTEKEATRLFGSTNVVGETIILSVADTVRALVITGVLAAAPERSHLNFDAVLHHSALANMWRGGVAYIMTETPLKQGFLESKVNTDPLTPGLLGPGSGEYEFRPMRQSYFSTENRMSFMQTRSQSFMHICTAVCVLICFMGSFNFANLLVIAQNERNKENAIRKTLGQGTSAIYQAALADVFVYILIAVPLSILIAAYIIPVFNEVLTTTMSSLSMLRAEVVAILIAGIITTGVVIAMLYARKMVTAKPINLMQGGTFLTRSHQPAFYLQFIITAAVVICTVTIIRQIRFIRSEPLGFERSIIQLSADESAIDRMTLLKNELSSFPQITKLSVSSGNPIAGNIVVRYDLEDGSFYTPYLFFGDEDLVSTLGLTVIEGSLPSGNNKLVNESFVRQFNIEDPVGKQIPGTGDRISGVVKDFTCGSFKTTVPPVIIGKGNASNLLINFSGGDLAEVLALTEKSWKKIFPEKSFDFQLIEHSLAQKYKEEIFLYRIAISAASISMLISIFGLFALCWNVVQRRTKEIGIRKVLGATVTNILSMLTLSFLRRIGIAFLIAAPIGSYLSDLWLQTFARRIELDSITFMYAAAVIVSITILTILFHVIRASAINPVEELKRD